jgi:hypothetical protein
MINADVNVEAVSLRQSAQLQTKESTRPEADVAETREYV